MPSDFSAVTRMDVHDYCRNGKRWWLRLHKKGDKFHDVPAHYNAETYLDAYKQAAGIADATPEPLFRTAASRSGQFSDRRMIHNDVLRMIKRRAQAAGLPVSTCCHTFRATSITAYLDNRGMIEHAQRIAAHESPRTTKLYDRTGDEITLDEIETLQI